MMQWLHSFPSQLQCGSSGDMRNAARCHIPTLRYMWPLRRGSRPEAEQVRFPLTQCRGTIPMPLTRNTLRFKSSRAIGQRSAIPSSCPHHGRRSLPGQLRFWAVSQRVCRVNRQAAPLRGECAGACRSASASRRIPLRAGRAAPSQAAPGLTGVPKPHLRHRDTQA